MRRLEEREDGDHAAVFKEIFAERKRAGLTGEDVLCLESNEELY